jgi:hypothetical protein
MARRTQITKRGLELLASSSKATGQHWWIGWYSLAYVPQEMKNDSGEVITSSSTKLTTGGDMIYNIFQGDMKGDGYAYSDTNSKFGMVNYDSNVKKNYRYVLDSSGRNNLVTWVDGDSGLKGAYVYRGVQISSDSGTVEKTSSNIPVPAPLFYTGASPAERGYSSTGMSAFLKAGKTDDVSNFFPTDTVGTVTVPRISTDFRKYNAYKSGFSVGGDTGSYSGNLPITGMDVDGWLASDQTYTQGDSTDMSYDYNAYCHEYWKALSISNFNRYCAPVNNSGLSYDDDTGCRNMAKVTKYFPVYAYDVTSTETTDSNEYVTGIRIKIKINLMAKSSSSEPYYSPAEANEDGTGVASLTDAFSNVTDGAGNQIFASNSISFKFNRMGIYAVPMRQYGCTDNNATNAQYQIDTESEPVLFAICDLDATTTISDASDGLNEFESDVFFDLSSAVADSAVIRESAVFYNLYSDDSIEWYKNQLIANASTAEAVTNMQIELGYLKNKSSSSGTCCPNAAGKSEEKSTYSGLRNLVDAKDLNSNSVRNRLAYEEGEDISAIYDSVTSAANFVGTTNGNLIIRESAGGTAMLAGGFSGAQTAKETVVTFDNKIFIYQVIDDTLAYTRAYGVPKTNIGKYSILTCPYYELSSVALDESNSRDVYEYDDNTYNPYINKTTQITTIYRTGIYASNNKATITKSSEGISTTTVVDGVTTTTDGMSLIASDSDLVNEISAEFNDHETERAYTFPYEHNQDGTVYKAVTYKFPRALFYKVSTSLFTDINNRISSTGWKIPTKAEWAYIINATDNDFIKRFRGETPYWAGITDSGTGGTYPLGGVYQSHSGWGITYGSADLPCAYFAISDDADNVVRFDGTTLSIVSRPSTTDYSVGYVPLILIHESNIAIPAITDYALGSDSYALMQGSVSDGEHDLNASEDSVMHDSPYSSMLSGYYNYVNRSSFTTLLGGHDNIINNTLYGEIHGYNNLVNGSSENPNTSMRLTGRDNEISGRIVNSDLNIWGSWVRSALISESAVYGRNITVNAAIVNSFINSYDLDVTSIISDSIINGEGKFGNVISSLCLTGKDSSEKLGQIDYSALIAYNASITEKITGSGNCQNSHSVIMFSEGDDLSSYIYHSDINMDIPFKDNGFESSYMNCVLEDVHVSHSSINMTSSSIGSNYIHEALVEHKGEVNHSFITGWSDLFTLAEATGNSHKIDYGVMMLDDSRICRSDCSYVDVSGHDICFTSSTLKYSTLRGDNNSLYHSNISYSSIIGKTNSLLQLTSENLHVFGTFQYTSNPPRTLNNMLMLTAIDGTTVGTGTDQAEGYISTFSDAIIGNANNYPMIVSMGGIGMYMNKMWLGNEGVSAGKSPAIGDVLRVVGNEGNLATVSWGAGGNSASTEYLCQSVYSTDSVNTGSLKLMKNYDADWTSNGYTHSCMQSAGYRSADGGYVNISSGKYRIDWSVAFNSTASVCFYSLIGNPVFYGSAKYDVNFPNAYFTGNSGSLIVSASTDSTVCIEASGTGIFNGSSVMITKLL